MNREPWTPEEDQKLITDTEEHDNEDQKLIADTEEHDEDQKLIADTEKHDHGNLLNLDVPAALERCAESSRRTWVNYPRPDIMVIVQEERKSSMDKMPLDNRRRRTFLKTFLKTFFTLKKKKKKKKKKYFLEDFLHLEEEEEEELLSNRWEEMSWEETTQKAEFLARKKDFLHLTLSYPMKRDAYPMERDEDVFRLLSNRWEEMTQKAEFLARKKDFLHLILSYPMEQNAYVDTNTINRLTYTFSKLNRVKRELPPLPSDNDYCIHGNKFFGKVIDEIAIDFLEAERNLAMYDFSMVAYLPLENDKIGSHESLKQRIEDGLRHRTSGTFDAPYEMLTMAINSATCQVSKYIEDGIFRKIGISGIGGEEVARAVIDTPRIRAKCSVVLRISVSRHHSIKEIRQNLTEQIRKLQQTDQKADDNFLLLVDCVDGQIDLHDLKLRPHGYIVLTTQSQKVYEIMEVDLEVRMEDHLLPWELFCRNVGCSLVNSSSPLQQMAIQLVKGCRCHLLAIILLARALKDATDIGVWELALSKLTSQSSRLGARNVMKHVLGLIWEQKDFRTKQCIKYCTSIWWEAKEEGLGTDALVSQCISNHSVETSDEGKTILEDLISSFLLESVGRYKLQMRGETIDVLQRYFTSSLPSPYLREGGSGLMTETPKVERWNAKEIELENNQLSELPENPKCPALTKLWLQNNSDLMKIPQLFFKDMPLLQDLDLSHTGIKSLPSSIARLVSLRTFNLRGCELLRTLPPEIGALGKLEVLDLEGTEIMHLPKEIGKLFSLRGFKVSLCGCRKPYGETEQVGTIIPTEVLSKFSRLEELCIDVIPDGDWMDAEVNPDSEWWDADVNAILNELSGSKKMRILKLYLPSAELLQQLRRDSKKLMYHDLYRFRFTVGRHQKRIIYRLSHEVEVRFNKWEEEFKKCLKYINGEGMPLGITEALKHASVFFLDRHWTVKALSEFGHENMVKLKCCLLVECNGLQTVIDGDYEHRSGVDKKSVFGLLRNLSIHYMKNLQSIWKGPIDKNFLSNLRSLALHTCPNLITIFTPDLLGNLRWLEELIVEDCPKIKSLVRQESSMLISGNYVPSLRKISLLDLPELVSISGCLSIGLLVDLIVYNCPKLESLYATEWSQKYYYKIKGEKEWWDSLKWHNPEWSRMTRPYYEEMDEDFMDQLAKDIYLN